MAQKPERQLYLANDNNGQHILDLFPDYYSTLEKAPRHVFNV